MELCNLVAQDSKSLSREFGEWKGGTVTEW